MPSRPIEAWVDQDEDVPDRVRSVDADLLVHRLTSALAFLASHACDRCGTTGTADIEVDFVDEMYSHPYTLPKPVVARPPRERAHPMTVASPAPFPHGTRTAVYAQAAITSLIDDLADARIGLVQAASPLADQIFHAFGIPEAHRLPHAGEIRTPAWHIQLRDAIASWALVALGQVGALVGMSRRQVGKASAQEARSCCTSRTIW